MLKLPARLKPSPKATRNFLIRLFTAIIAAHFIVVHGEDKSWIVLWQSPAYYISVGCSAVIALILIKAVYYITKKLNQKQGGFNITRKRVIHQLIFGFGFTALIAIVLASGLFYCFGHNIFKSTYFNDLYPYIVLFIGTVNVTYCLYYLYKKPQKALVRFRILNTAQNNPDNKLPLLHETAIFYIKGTHCMTLNFDGRVEICPDNIKRCMELLNHADYHQIQRDCIVNRKVISSIERFGNKQFKIMPSVDFEEELIVSKSRSPDFKLWLAQPAAEDPIPREVV